MEFRSENSESNSARDRKRKVLRLPSRDKRVVQTPSGDPTLYLLKEIGLQGTYGRL